MNTNDDGIRMSAEKWLATPPPAPAPVTEPLKVKRMYPSPEEYARQHPEVLADERPEAELKGDAPATGTLTLNAMFLLKTAKCPNCDGSGGIPVQVSSRQYVTREMAMDAGDLQMEGTLYSDDEWEQQQCRWCYERDQIVSEFFANHPEQASQPKQP